MNEIRLQLALAIRECQRIMFELMEVRKIGGRQVKELQSQLEVATRLLPLDCRYKDGQVVQYVYRYVNMTTEERREVSMLPSIDRQLALTDITMSNEDDGGQ